MKQDPPPCKTPQARVLLAGPRQAMAPALRMLLISVDGRRPLAELRGIARSLGLSEQVLERLQADGLLHFGPPDGASAGDTHTAAMPDPAAALRRLMKAKMFALDLAGRMLTGRDAELRASARQVDSEESFLIWLDAAADRIAQVSDKERAQLFRERVADAASG